MRLIHAALLCVASSFMPPAASQEPAVIELEIREDTVSGRRLVASRPAPVLRLKLGEEVVLRWTSDQTHVLHLHGYKLQARVPAGGRADMHVRARAAGRFPLETHGSTEKGKHRTLMFLEVHPR